MDVHAVWIGISSDERGSCRRRRISCEFLCRVWIHFTLCQHRTIRRDCMRPVFRAWNNNAALILTSTWRRKEKMSIKNGIEGQFVAPKDVCVQMCAHFYAFNVTHIVGICHGFIPFSNTWNTNNLIKFAHILFSKWSWPFRFCSLHIMNHFPFPRTHIRFGISSHRPKVHVPSWMCMQSPIATVGICRINTRTGNILLWHNTRKRLHKQFVCGHLTRASSVRVNCAAKVIWWLRCWGVFNFSRIQDQGVLQAAGLIAVAY